jgi:hypothetical protein
MELGFQPLERRALVTRWQRHMRPTQRQQARPFIEPENPPAPSARAAEEKRARSAIWIDGADERNAPLISGKTPLRNPDAHWPH